MGEAGILGFLRRKFSRSSGGYSREVQTVQSTAPRNAAAPM
jgi:hypothetical protein